MDARIRPWTDLHGADLHGADLHGADLHGANLHGANLHGTDLRQANLCGANLCEANLCEANLCEANLYGANLCGADLHETSYIVGPQRSDGYRFDYDGARVRAGCRYFTFEQFRAHVAAEYPDTPKAVETLAILDYLEARAKAMENA